MRYCTVAYIEGIILRTRNSSGDEIANMNFLYDDIEHALQNTIDSCINSATDRRGYDMLEHSFTKFSEITQCNGHYDKVPHLRLLEKKIKKHGVEGKVLRIIGDWLMNRKQSVCIFRVNGRVGVKYGMGSHRAQYWGPCYS